MIQLLRSALFLLSFFALGTFLISFAFGAPYSFLGELAFFWESVGGHSRIMQTLVGLMLCTVVVGQIQTFLARKDPIASLERRIVLRKKTSRIAFYLLQVAFILASVVGLVAGAVFLYGVSKQLRP